MDKIKLAKAEKKKTRGKRRNLRKILKFSVGKSDGA